MAFSNGTEFEGWAAGWCYGCKNYEDCEILDEAVIFGNKPAEWTLDRPHSFGKQYICEAYESDKDSSKL